MRLAPRGAWSAVEEKRLIAAVEACRGHDWRSISRFVGRETHDCIAHYQRKLNPALVRRTWSGREDVALKDLVLERGLVDWHALADRMPGRTPQQVRDRWHRALNPQVVRGSWHVAEERRLMLSARAYHADHFARWAKARLHTPHRTEAQAREKWVNTLDPLVKAGPWAAAEDAAMDAQIESHGVGRWAEIASNLAGRTDVQCMARFERRFPHRHRDHVAYVARHISTFANTTARRTTDKATNLTVDDFAMELAVS